MSKILKILPLIIIVFVGIYFISQKKTNINSSPVTEITNQATKTISCGNETTNLQLALQNPSSVCNLNLSGQNLKTLPSEIGKLENLKVFNISNNQFTGIPAEIGKFKKLETFNASSNQITDVPAEIGHLSTLQELNLSNNKLDTMPDEFAELKSLKKIDLSNNLYREIPKEVLEMANLEEISISGNSIPDADIQRLKQQFPNSKID